jgi:NADP-dependent 3-hydroxy acid dehydrogenase YdfG
MNYGRAWELSAKQWQQTIDTNLTGVWNTMKVVVPAMIAAGNGGSIIIISSADRHQSGPSVRALLRKQIRGSGPD